MMVQHSIIVHLHNGLKTTKIIEEEGVVETILYLHSQMYSFSIIGVEMQFIGYTESELNYLRDIVIPFVCAKIEETYLLIPLSIIKKWTNIEIQNNILYIFFSDFCK